MVSRPAVKLDTALEVAAYEAAVKALHDQLASGFGEPFKDADYPFEVTDDLPDWRIAEIEALVIEDVKNLRRGVE